MRTGCIRIHRHGGPEVLHYETVELAPPGPGEVLLRQTAIGVNYADIYQREGGHGPHDSQAMPFVPGAQGVGVVEAVGAGVDGFAAGDRVALIAPGAYAERRLVPAERLLHLPDDITDEAAAALLLRALTAEYLLCRLFRVQPGQSVLVHAAAGGVGLVLGRWAHALGARTIGTVGSEAKAGVARAHGYDEVIVDPGGGFAGAVLALTDQVGVDVVYDGVGKTAFLPSLDCVKPMGMVISFGTASGDVGMFDLQALHRKSIIVTRPTLRTWIASRRDYEAAGDAVFEAIRSGTIGDIPVRRYALRDAALAHAELQSRRTTGALVLMP